MKYFKELFKRIRKFLSKFINISSKRLGELKFEEIGNEIFLNIKEKDECGKDWGRVIVWDEIGCEVYGYRSIIDGGYIRVSLPLMFLIKTYGLENITIFYNGVSYSINKKILTHVDKRIQRQKDIMNKLQRRGDENKKPKTPHSIINNTLDTTKRDLLYELIKKLHNDYPNQ